jgi:hypothetical protein
MNLDVEFDFRCWDQVQYDRAILYHYRDLLLLLFDILLYLPACWLEVSIRKVLRTATSAQVLLGFPVSKSEC